MSQVDEILAPEPAAPDPVSSFAVPSDPGVVSEQRRRRWLTAALAGLLVVLYLVAWVTYTRLHLAPQQYEPLPPGAVASKLGADFALVGLTQTTVLAGKYDNTATASAGAVWIVARLDVTRRAPAENFNCQLILVGSDGRSWEPATLLSVSRDLERCPPDDAPFGQTTRVETFFEVPVVDADRIVGVAVPQNDSSRNPVLTLPR